jgi:peroxiredoxin
MLGEGVGSADQEHSPAADPSVRRRLDPERAAAARRAARHSPPPVIDTRPYQRMIGLFGLLLVIIISVAFLTSRGVGTAGVPAGKRLPMFAAPLATSNLNGAVNLRPPCTEAQHHPGVLNICLLVKRAPLVLAFFVTSSSGCEQAVDALQRVSEQLPAGRVQVAAVAVRASHADAAQAVRQHHWTIPVAYDVDGRLGAAYGVEVCPIFQLAQRGGLVERRLIGQHWASAGTLEPPVRDLLAQAGR